ncbi:uncharacterized protein DEA37_0013694 [Paragonimus westermani]|uniref:C2H2-type domain-containing protein n=1 Tax=Paragonimus westermani TaxID=34504 RepID=A0A5J4P0T0_9TREM|nr:uncharacterized protein DEA37_0013694 [Paragonimus westermani]
MLNSDEAVRKMPKKYSNFVSPGDILFSTVAGGPAHVHSPEEFQQRLDHFNSNTRLGCSPASLSNSLLDPNIELPTISVCEVDAVLSNICSSSLSSLSSKVIPTDAQRSSCRTFTHSQIPESSLRHSLSPECSFSTDSCESVFHLKNLPTVPKTEVTCYKGAYSPLNTRRAFSFSVNIVSNGTKGLFENAHTDFRALRTKRDYHTPLGCTSSSSKRFTVSNHETPNDSLIGGKTCILPDFLPKSSQPVAGFSDFLVNPTSNVKDHQVLKQHNSEFERNERKVRQPSHPPPLNNCAVSRSPFDGLDLATSSRRMHHPPLAAFDAYKCREANLSVRRANQAQFCFSRVLHDSGAGSLVASSTVSEFSSPVLTQPIVKSCKPPLATLPLSCLPCSWDERFKYIGPHPRCGCRYQAEPSLLRHLSKYHGEPINALQQKRQAARLSVRRRTASEERSPVQDGNEFGRRSISNAYLLCGTMTPLCLDRPDPSDGTRVPNDPVCLAHQSSLPAVTANHVYRNTDVSSQVRSQIKTHVVDVTDESGPTQLQHSNNTTPTIFTGQALPQEPIEPGPMSDGPHPAEFTRLSQSAQPNDTELSSVATTTLSRPPRLRSASGSDGGKPAIENSGSRMVTPLNNQCSPAFVDFITVPFAKENSKTRKSLENDPGFADTETCSDIGRRRTLSTGAEPRNLHRSNDHTSTSLLRLAGQMNSCATCPSCGFGLDETELKHREWMSGVRALTYSKTDSICCPIDGCTHVCLGRADLSAHLTNCHFPEVKNQLVRLIFACPVKDCQMVCADEKNFQTHFNRHLFGYLPGDLSGLFPPIPLAPSADDLKAHSTNLDLDSPSPSSVTNSEPKIPSLSNSLSPTRPGSFPVVEPISVDRLTPSKRGVCSSLTPSLSPRAKSDRSGSISANLSSTLDHMDESLESQTVETQRSVTPQALTVDVPFSISSSHNTAQGRIRQNDLIDQYLLPSSAPSIPDPDLTDHRNLLSALDLIPDDILMELLKEERPGIWGDGSNIQASACSAPHTWDSLEFIQPDLDPKPNDSHVGGNNSNPGTEADAVIAESDNREPFLGKTDACSEHPNSCTNLPMPGSTCWVPSPVVHETWSSAVSNERHPNSALSDIDRLGLDDCVNNMRDCPRHVLSDLTAALILPDVERRLKASISTKKWTMAVTAPPTALSSGCPIQPDSLSSIGLRNGRRACCTGKRRRNASESSPTTLQHDSSPTQSVAEHVHSALPFKSMKHVDSESSAEFHNTACFAMSGSPHFTEESVLMTLGRNSKSPTSLRFVEANTQPAQSLSLRPQFSLDSEQSQGNTTMEAFMFQPNLESSFTSHASSPKLSEVEPKKRRRKLVKMMTVASGSRQVSGVLPERDYSPPLCSPRTVLPRRHSMIYCNLVNSTNSH